MRVLSRCLRPTSNLPPIRTLRSASEEAIGTALKNLHALYCPLRFPLGRKLSISRPEPVDSGYASEDDNDDQRDDDSDGEDDLAVLRADTYERDFSVRWLMALIARAEELSIDDDDIRNRIVDDAAFILASFTESWDDDEDDGLTRDFSFPTSLDCKLVNVSLNDAPLSSTDHTDVGLQSWGASIIMSELICASPERLGLDNFQLGSTVVELGAGTGLVGLTIAKLLPHLSSTRPTVVATDYHPAVLENLRANITTNFGSSCHTSIQTLLLDWSAPVFQPPLDKRVAMLIASDVVYAPEHAILLREVAGQMLARNGIFWLMVTVREHGKFQGILETVESAFAKVEDSPGKSASSLNILAHHWIEKKKGIGRGDEVGYRLYQIGWVSL